MTAYIENVVMTAAAPDVTSSRAPAEGTTDTADKPNESGSSAPAALVTTAAHDVASSRAPVDSSDMTAATSDEVVSQRPAESTAVTETGVAVGRTTVTAYSVVTSESANPAHPTSADDDGKHIRFMYRLGSRTEGKSGLLV